MRNHFGARSFLCSFRPNCRIEERFRAYFPLSPIGWRFMLHKVHKAKIDFLVNYSVTELPEHLNRGGIPPFSGCVHDTTTVYSFELYSYFYDFRCFQSGHGQFFFYSGYGEIFSQDIICTDSIRIIILVSISV